VLAVSILPLSKIFGFWNCSNSVVFFVICWNCSDSVVFFVICWNCSSSVVYFVRFWNCSESVVFFYCYCHKCYEFDSRIWRCAFDTTSCDNVCQWLALVSTVTPTNKTGKQRYNLMKNKTTTLSQQFHNPIEKITEKCKIDTPNKLSWLDIGMSIESGGVKLVLWVQTSHLSQMMRPCMFFTYVSKITTLTYNCNRANSAIAEKYCLKWR